MQLGNWNIMHNSQCTIIKKTIHIYKEYVHYMWNISMEGEHMHMNIFIIYLFCFGTSSFFSHLVFRECLSLNLSSQFPQIHWPEAPNIGWSQLWLHQCQYQRHTSSPSVYDMCAGNDNSRHHVCMTGMTDQSTT